MPCRDHKRPAASRSFAFPLGSAGDVPLFVPSPAKKAIFAANRKVFGTFPALDTDLHFPGATGAPSFGCPSSILGQFCASGTHLWAAWEQVNISNGEPLVAL